MRHVGAMLALLLVLAGCSQPAAPAAGSPGAQESAAAVSGDETTPAAEGEIQDGGTLNYGFAQATRDFNPLTASGGIQADLFRFLFNRLLTYDVGVENLVPELAESYEVSDDGTIITFHLRDDVTWHDGEPFTAADVAFTYRLAMNPETTSRWTDHLSNVQGREAFLNGESEDVSGIQVLDDYTVQFTLDRPDAAFLNQLAPLLSILPEHLLNDVDPANLAGHEFIISKPVGTGPFALANFVENQYIEFVRNEEYFRGRPHIEKVNFRILTDDTVAVAGLEAGEIDITRNVPAADLERFENRSDFYIYWQPSVVFCNLTFNSEKPYLTPEIRQAIAYAIDYDTLLDAFLGATAEPLDSPFAFAWLDPVPEELMTYHYDPERARELLAEAGWDPSQTIDFLFGGGEPDEKVVFIQQNLIEVGLNVEIRSGGDGAAQNTEVYEQPTFDMFYGCNESGFDPHKLWDYFGTDAFWPTGRNASRYSNPRVDELFDLGRFTLNQEERKQYYNEMQVIISQELPKIVLWRTIGPWVINSRLHDATPQYHGSRPNYNGLENWWLSE